MHEAPVPDWAQIRRRYEDTDDATADICAEAQIDRRELDRIRKKEGWRRHNPRPFPPARKIAAARAEPEPPALPVRAPASPHGTEPLTSISNHRLLERLVTAIAMKLEQLERRMTKDLAAPEAADAKATDHEREARAIGALIDNIGKITELETGHANSASSKHGATATDLADEAERCRRELAERLSRLVETATRDA